jgi:hypothetical protein
LDARRIEPGGELGVLLENAYEGVSRCH